MRTSHALVVAFAAMVVTSCTRRATTWTEAVGRTRLTSAAPGAQEFVPPSIPLYVAADAERACLDDQIPAPHFEIASNVIAPGDKPTIFTFAKCLAAPEMRRVTVELIGKGDPGSIPRPDRDLGLARALVVKELIVLSGIDPARIVVRSVAVPEEPPDFAKWTDQPDVDVVLVR